MVDTDHFADVRKMVHIFSTDNPDAYHHFADGECKVLIASEELGVGINLPDVRCIIHFGLPLSKSEYVQEIGRAGRANEAITSYVLYLANEEQNVPKQLLKRDTKITAIPGMLRNLKNDYGDIYRKLTNNSPAMEDLIEKLKRFYQTLDTSVNALFVKKSIHQGRVADDPAPFYRYGSRQIQLSRKMAFACAYAAAG